MTRNEVAELLYSQALMETDTYFIDAWFSKESGKKFVSLIHKQTREETEIVVNDMTIDELSERLAGIL